MHAWPRSVKRVLLTLSILAVVVSYVLLMGGTLVGLVTLAKVVIGQL
jgi:hypothetical protein